MSYILCGVIGYLLGSIPTAYIILKQTKGIDITKDGTGNVGAMNSYRVSKSKKLAALVFVIDMLKGLLSALVVKLLFPDEYLCPMIALIAAVLSHCYSPWIKFKGGRGLATSAGGALVLSTPILVLWGLSWLMTFSIKKNVHIANFAATMLAMIISLAAFGYIDSHSSIHAANFLQFGTSLSILFIIILTKHIEPLRKLSQ